MIDSRIKLGEFALRQLGHPVIQINVSEDQIDDAIDSGLQKYYEFHGDGSQRTYLKHIMTQDNIDKNEIVLPDDVMSVIQVLNVGTASMFNMNNLSHIAYITDLASGFGKDGLGNYVRSMSYLSTIDNILNPAKSLRFKKYGHKIKLDGTASLTWKLDDLIVIQCYTKNSAEEYPETYGDYWLKRYVTALIKKQWANNLIKYNGFQLPNGLTIDGGTILSEANADLEHLDEELRTTWEEPILPMIG